MYRLEKSRLRRCHTKSQAKKKITPLVKVQLVVLPHKNPIENILNDRGGSAGCGAATQSVRGAAIMELCWSRNCSNCIQHSLLRTDYARPNGARPIRPHSLGSRGCGPSSHKNLFKSRLWGGAYLLLDVLLSYVFVITVGCIIWPYIYVWFRWYKSTYFPVIVIQLYNYPVLE